MVMLQITNKNTYFLLVLSLRMKSYDVSAFSLTSLIKGVRPPAPHNEA